MWAVGCAAAVLVLVVLVRTAWMSDDAYITLRTVDNFANGYGLRWNVIERVQTFTHPAWLFLITPFYLVTHEAYFTVIAIQIVLTLLTVILCCRFLAPSPSAAALGVAALVGSKAFIDFSTSGLENPLVHLAIVLFLVAWHRDRARRGSLLRLGLLGSVLLLCRLDLIALIAPLVATALRPWSRARARSLLLGLVPLVVWEFFSLLYYGSLVPNTALAKLPAGVPMSALVAQGFRYLVATSYFDPVTIAVLVACLAVLIAGGRGAGRIIALGVALHLAAVVAVGGDFMAGRFITPSFTLAVAATVSLAARPGKPATQLVAAVALLAASVLVTASPLRTGADLQPAPEGEFARYGVTDERRFYYPSLGLLRVMSGQTSPGDHGWSALGRELRAGVAKGGERLREASNVGLFGYYAGPDIYVVDRNALTDPFLARLPPAPGWRVGHYTRTMPAGYVESRRSDRNVVEDPNLHRLYDDVHVVTREPIWSARRFGIIAAWLTSPR